MTKFKLEVLADKYKIVCFPVDYNLDFAKLLSNSKKDFLNISQSSDELSIICNEEFQFESFTTDINVDIYNDKLKIEAGWKAFRILGTLDFGMVGVLSSILNLLAKKNISILAVSTYNTDYILVKEEKLREAINAIEDSNIAEFTEYRQY
ncbi:MAG: ACT domain-containing protein [Candidatus Caenarcaniphilales bacterium]|nr:ACT domain-containing protein [Candidatus Caenarcaniphilales bacterium]